MSTLEQDEKHLRLIARKIDAKLITSPPSCLVSEEMIPDFKVIEKELIILVEDLNFGVSEICEDNESQLGQTKVTAWNDKLISATSKMIKYRQDIAFEMKKLKQTPLAISTLMTGHQTSPSLNSTFEQDRLAFEKDKLSREEAIVQLC